MSYASWSVVFGEQPSAAKWNILGTNDSSFNDGTGIADSAILPKHLFTGTGSAWPYTSYTPTFTSITVGNGTLTAYYRQYGKMVHTYGALTFGSTSVMGTDGYFTMPVNAHANVVDYTALGTYSMLDSSAATFFGGAIVKQVNATTPNCLRPLYYSPSGGALTLKGTAINQPFGANWATGDFLIWSAHYEAA